MAAFTLKINGGEHHVDVDPQTPLLWAIRDGAGRLVRVGPYAWFTYELDVAGATLGFDVMPSDAPHLDMFSSDTLARFDRCGQSELRVSGAPDAALPGHVFGLVVSIPLVIAGSQIIMKLIERFPVLILAGGGLLGWVAGEMIVEDVALAPWLEGRAHVLHWAVPIAGVVLVVGVAKWMQARQAARASP